MKANKVLFFSIIFIIIFNLVGCNVENQESVEEMKEELKILAEKAETLSHEFEAFRNENVSAIKVLETENINLKKEISNLNKLIEINNNYGDLIDLDYYEQKKYEEFKLSYDDYVLIDLQPISICKMYLYASLVEDYDMVYELYTTNDEYVHWTKEEDQNIPQEHRRQDFTIFKDVYDLNVNYSQFDEEHATITWKSKNGYIEEQEMFTYIFTLIKDADVWKVNFLPMQ